MTPLLILAVLILAWFAIGLMVALVVGRLFREGGGVAR